VDRDSVAWRGYIPAVTTPFGTDLEVDFVGWEELLEWMVAQGMHGIAVAATTGEWFSLAPWERKELFKTAAVQIDGRIPVLAGCNALTPREVIEYATAAETHGLDGILLTPPPYVNLNRQEVIAFYRAVSDAIALPICAYNWPLGTGIDMDVTLVEELAEIDNIVAIKNSTGDFALFIEVFYAVKDELRYFGFPMNEVGITLLRHAGGDGTIGAAGILGSDQPDFFNHVWSGELEAARRCGERDRLIFDHWINPDYSAKFGSAQALMKAALNLQGLPGGSVRPPLAELTNEEIVRVSRTLAELGLVASAA